MNRKMKANAAKAAARENNRRRERRSAASYSVESCGDCGGQIRPTGFNIEITPVYDHVIDKNKLN